VTVREKKFFGHERAKIDNEQVIVSDLEKTLIDSLDRPALVGGIEAVARFIQVASPRTDFEKLLQYTKRNGNRALAVRLGYLVETLRIPKIPEYFIHELRRHVNHLITPFGEVKRWGKSGHINPNWNIIENVPINNLTSEIEIA
jgi:predicted transcriptional regulator of viral defense system